MKALFIYSFLIMTLLPLVGCGSKENAVSLKVSTSFALGSSGFTGGLVVSGKNAIGQRFVNTVFGGTSLKVVLPDGAWDISVVGWDGAAPSSILAPFSGIPYCGKSSINLAAADVSATVEINKANCLTADFAQTAHVSVINQTIHPLKVVTCAAFYLDATAASKMTAANSSTFTSDFCQVPSHPSDLRSRTKSIKIIPLSKNFDGPFSGQPANNPYCLASTSGNDGIFHLPEQIPTIGLPFQIALFEDDKCMDQKSFLLFPDGLLSGYAPKFDSILDYKAGDTNPAASVGNRLIVSDNGLNRGWSPFYGLMPDMKCSGGHCGDFLEGSSGAKYSDSIFDYFMEVDYQAPLNESQSLEFPADSDICADGSKLSIPTIASGTNYLVKTACTYSSSNGKGKITVMVRPKDNITAPATTDCNAELNSICRSPAQKFVLKVNGEEKEIYFNGKQDYAGKTTVPFSHLFMLVRTSSNVATTSCSSYGAPGLTSATTFNVLSPTIECWDSISTPSAATPVIMAKPYYDNTTNFTFQVDDSGLTGATISYSDTSPSSMNLVMLPPSTWEQKDVVGEIFESIGGKGFRDSFRYSNNQNDDDDQGKESGTIRKIREMFSPDGPGGLFDHTLSCSSTAATKSVTLSDKDGLHTYEITVANIGGLTSTEPKYVRPNNYCKDTVLTPTPGTCPNAPADNYGKFEKAMTMKKDGVMIGVMLFDCAAKRGRLETKEVSFDSGKYRRDKQIVYWNTQNAAYKRVEVYSRNMESSNNTFSAITRDGRKFEKIYNPTGLSDVITGRIYNYSVGIESATAYKNLKATRFEVDVTGTPAFRYAFFNFHVPPAVDFFATGGEYSTLKVASFSTPHFCSTALAFPLTYSPSCTMFNATESGPVLGNAAFGTTYQSVQPGSGFSFDTIMGDGFFPVAW